MRNRLERGLIAVVMTVAVFVSAVPFFMAVNLSVWSSGWTDLAAAVGYCFAGAGILRTTRLALRYQRKFAQLRAVKAGV